MTKLSSLYPVEIAPGWYAHVELDLNSAGNFVITKLEIKASGKSFPDEGLPVAVLRSIKMRDLIASAISDNEEIYIDLLAQSPYDWTDELNQAWLTAISGEWQRQGRKPHDISLYAKTAFYYVMELRSESSAPLQSLALKLEVDRTTLARRIDTARKLGLLTRPASGDKPSGKPGGKLTDKANEILGIGIKGETK